MKGSIQLNLGTLGNATKDKVDQVLLGSKCCSSVANLPVSRGNTKEPSPFFFFSLFLSRIVSYFPDFSQFSPVLATLLKCSKKSLVQ